MKFNVYKQKRAAILLSCS